MGEDTGPPTPLHEHQMLVPKATCPAQAPSGVPDIPFKARITCAAATHRWVKRTASLMETPRMAGSKPSEMHEKLMWQSKSSTRDMGSSVPSHGPAQHKQHIWDPDEGRLPPSQWVSSEQWPDVTFSDQNMTIWIIVATTGIYLQQIQYKGWGVRRL